MKKLTINITQEAIDNCRSKRQCPVEYALEKAFPGSKVFANYLYIGFHENKNSELIRKQYKTSKILAAFMQAFDTAGHVWPRKFVVYQEG
jgi:hypothetical protein